LVPVDRVEVAGRPGVPDQIDPLHQEPPPGQLSAHLDVLICDGHSSPAPLGPPEGPASGAAAAPACPFPAGPRFTCSPCFSGCPASRAAPLLGLRRTGRHPLSSPRTTVVE